MNSDPVFYEKDFLRGKNSLDREESHHCIAVWRRRVGDTITVFDGLGRYATANITRADKQECLFEITAQKHAKKAVPYVHLAVAPVKHLHRLEWLVEKAQEIGIDEISFIVTRHSGRKTLNRARLLKKAVSAMKQCGYPFLTKLNGPVPFEDYLKAVSEDRKYIAHPGSGASPTGAMRPGVGSATVLIGPEGDFTGQEIRRAEHAGFTAVLLGPSTYRTETAGLLAGCWLKGFLSTRSVTSA